MAEIKQYVTLRHEASAEFEEKRSVFIGYAKPVKTEAEAMEFVKKIRGKHGVKPVEKFGIHLSSVREIDVIQLIVGADGAVARQLRGEINAANEAAAVALGGHALEEQHILVLLRQGGNARDDKLVFVLQGEFDHARFNAGGMDQGKGARLGGVPQKLGIAGI